MEGRGGRYLFNSEEREDNWICSVKDKRKNVKCQREIRIKVFEMH